MKYKLACLQMNSTSVVSENLAFIERSLAAAQDQGVDILQLPENFAQMPASAKQQVSEVEGNGEIQAFVSHAAADYQMSIIAGSIPILPKSAQSHKSKPNARSLAIDCDSGQAFNYDKIHLFDVCLPSGKRYSESDQYAYGNEDAANRVVASLGGLKVGLSICYDLRFPELYRDLAAQGAEILCVPSAFTYDTGKAHWQTLLQSRAIENLCFVFAAAQTGFHASRRRTWGHSMIINPWGEIMAVADEEPGLLVAEIDLDDLIELRAQFPSLKHRRL